MIGKKVFNHVRQQVIDQLSVWGGKVVDIPSNVSSTRINQAIKRKEQQLIEEEVN